MKFHFILSEEKRRKDLRLFDLIISHCGEGTLLRGGRTEGFKRHPSASTGFTVEYGLAMSFRPRTLFPISRAVSRNL